MRSGKLRHLVDIENASGDLTSRGYRSRTWSALYSNIWASIETLSGREAEQAHQLFANAAIKITIRYHDSVTTKCRVKFGTRYFYIGFVNNIDQRNRVLELLCTEESE